MTEFISVVSSHQDIDTPCLLSLPVELASEKHSTICGIHCERGVAPIIWNIIQWYGDECVVPRCKKECTTDGCTSAIMSTASIARSTHCSPRDCVE